MSTNSNTKKFKHLNKNEQLKKERYHLGKTEHKHFLQRHRVVRFNTESIHVVSDSLKIHWIRAPVARPPNSKVPVLKYI